MKYLILIWLLFIVLFNSWAQVDQVSVGLGRADQWGKSTYTYNGDTAIAYESQLSMDSRTAFVVSMDHSLRSLKLYHTLSFSVMFPEYSIVRPGPWLLQDVHHKMFIKAPTFDYSINASLLRLSKRLTLFGGLNLRAQWALEKELSSGLSDWLSEWIVDANNSLTPITLGLNLNLRYQTRWLRAEFGYIPDFTSSARDINHKGEVVPVSPMKMQKIYLVLSAPVLRMKRSPKRIKKKDKAFK
jgi:hypothetical protein